MPDFSKVQTVQASPRELAELLTPVHSFVRRRFITERTEVVMIGDHEAVLRNETGHLHTVRLEELLGPDYRVV